jgi:hypothetical protein
MKSYAKLFTENRTAVLDLIASGVEAYYRQRTALEKTLPEPLDESEEEKDGGDFLHDFLHLNVQYLNQLARLGSSYSVVGARALERIYEWAQPPDAVDASDEGNRLSGSAGEELMFAFHVTNEGTSNAEARVACVGFPAERKGEDPLFHFEFMPSESFRIGAKKTQEVAVQYRVPSKLKANVEYRGKVVVEVDGQPDTEVELVVSRRPTRRK